MDNPNQFYQLFNSYYYAHDCGHRTYQRDEYWLDFFDKIAQRIVEEFHPRTVLDAGCAMGLLVEGLRKRGVEAWGIDISAYAIEQVQADIRPFCTTGSIAQPLPGALPPEYDLVVTIEVLEHMPEEDGKAAVEMLCRLAKDVLCSAAPQNYGESTHVNVQPPDYWVQQFARQGFFRDVDFDGNFITPWTMRFRKGVEPVHQVIRDYERQLWRLKAETHELRLANLEAKAKIQEISAQLERVSTAESPPDGQVSQLQARIDQLEGELAAREAHWANVQSGFGWKLLEAARRLRLRIIPLGSRREKWLYRLIHR